jgi:uncharacterized protein YdhG (YjbR/CyaY superfamily)
MKNQQPVAQDIDEYIARFPEEIQEILQKIRITIRKAAPQADETISYNMPTFNFNGNYLIYFAAYKKHIALYPAPLGVPEFEEAISPYVSGKGTLQFPLNQPIPYKLITEIVKFRAKEILARAQAKGTK